MFEKANCGVKALSRIKVEEPIGRENVADHVPDAQAQEKKRQLITRVTCLLA